jgi:SWI/SNF-related matrix-associated actin-dependent regulator of chromatin subfamily A3
MPPRRKRAAAEAPEYIDLTGDAVQPAPKRPALSSSQSGTSSGATNRQRTQAIPPSSFQLSTQEPDYLDLTQEDDTLDRELYGTFGSFTSTSFSLVKNEN